MSGSGTIYTEQSVLGHTLGFAPMAFPAQVFVGLCSAAMPPSETVQGIEAFGGGYTRMPATFALIDTPANIAANVASIEWPIAAAAWGTLGFFELWDSASGGNRLYWGPFSPATTITVSAGDIVRFSAGTLAVQAATGAGGTASIGAYLPLAGGVLTGPLLLAADPTTYLQAATKQYVDAHSGGSSGGPGFLPLSGGTMLGTLTLAGNALLPLQAVPLQQVDTLNVVNVLNHGAKGDGTTDDTAAIQNVLNAYAATATVFIPYTGANYRTSALTLPSGTNLLLFGNLVALPGLTGGYINVSNAVSVIIRGNGVINGNAPAQTAVSGMAGLAINASSNVRVSGIRLTNAFHWNLNVTQSSNVVVDDVTITAGGAANEFAAGSSDCWLTNCEIDGTGLGDYAFCFYGGVTNSGAIGNVVKNAGAGTTSGPPGIGVMSDSAQPRVCSDIIIADNVIHGCAASGITILGNPGTAIQYGIVITGNRCHDNGKNATPAAQVADIYIDYVNGVTVIGNQSSNFGSSSYPGCGMYLGSNASYVGVFSNQIFNDGQGTASTAAGVWLNGPNHVNVSNNWFYDNQTTQTMEYSLIGSVGPGCIFTGNNFGVPASFTLQTDTVMANYSPDNFDLGPNTRLQIAGVQMYKNAANAPRWYAGNNGSTEGGGNSGSDFEIVSVSDGNAPLAATLTIKRSTGVVTLGYAPTITNLPTNAANDAAAATAGVPVGGTYRNGSVMMVRVA